MCYSLVLVVHILDIAIATIYNQIANMQGKRIVYLDHAAATPLDSRVKEAMLPYLGEQYGNPSAIYSLGRAAKEALDNARQTVAQILGCRAAEIVFTGSGTESDNLAIFGVTHEYATRGKHVITTNFEHHAVLNPCRVLEKQGQAVTYLKVDPEGLITPAQLTAAIRLDTILISVMYANNEVGTIEPIAELASAVHKWKKENGRRENDPPFLHTDACQATGYLDMDVQKLGVDLMTINGSKVYGPKGVGALYVRRGVKLVPVIYGGGQEFGLRSGTENVAGIVGLARALEIAQVERDNEIVRLIPLRNKLMHAIIQNIPKVTLNGPIDGYTVPFARMVQWQRSRLPNNVNITIAGIEGEAMLFYLDEAGIAASTSSACEAAGPDPSHVIQALGKSHDAARSSVRLTLGRDTTEADIDYVLEVLPKIVQKLRHK